MALAVDVLVVPKAKKQRCLLDTRNQLKCYLVSPPEKGKANKELIDLFAQALRLPRSAIVITHGESFRSKRMVIDADIDFKQVLLKLGIETQLTID